MSYLVDLVCTRCRRHFSANKVQTICEKCNAPLFPQYDLEKVKDAWRKEDLQRRRPDMFRYIELLPVSDERRIVSLGEGLTPILKVTKVEQRIGLRELYVKDDGIIPTGTFKARGMATAITKAKEFGIRRVAVPSAGNAAGACATYGAKAGIDIYVIVPVGAPLSCKIESVVAGAKVYLVAGSISDAGRIVNEGKEEFGWFDISTMKEPYRVEGKKTMGLEIAEQFRWRLPDVILYPTGGGTGLIGMWKAFSELKELGWIEDNFPRMFAVQSQGCAPIVKAYKEGKKESEFWEGADTIAGGLRVPKAFADFLILEVIRESGGSAVSVSDGEMIEASRELAREGIFACPEGSATLAGLRNLVEDGAIDKEENILLYNTGSGIKYTDVYSENLKLDLPVISSIHEIVL